MWNITICYCESVQYIYMHTSIPVMILIDTGFDHIQDMMSPWNIEYTLVMRMPVFISFLLYRFLITCIRL